MEGGLEALPVNETSGSDGEKSVDPSAQCGFMVDWGLFVLAARWFAAFLSASPASVVAASRSCGSALLVSWLCSGTCFQPCLWFIRQRIDVADLEGLWGACGALAAASVYMFRNLSKPAAAAALASAFEFTVVLVGDLLCLVGAFAVSFVLEIWSAAAITYLFCKESMLAAAAFASTFPVALVGKSESLVGAFVDLSFLGAGSAAATGLCSLMRWVPAAASSVAFALSETFAELAVLVGTLKFVGFVFTAPSVYLCLLRGRSPKEEKVFYGPIFCTSQKQSCQVESSPDYDQGSGKHGIVSSLPEGLGQASGRVDVPDDAKFEAAAAFGGTLRSGPGSLDALGSARSREGKIQFFLKGHDGCTRVINCHDGDLIHDVVGYFGWDIYATLHGHILDLSGTLRGQGVSDDDTIRISCRLRGGSNNADIPGQWQCANCDATRCWPVRRNCYRCGAPRPDTPPAPAPWNAGRARGRSKGPLGRDPPSGPSSVPPTTREPRVVPPRGPPGAGVGTPPKGADSAVVPGELLGALKLLQTVMSAEDFSKYEKLVAPPSKEERTKEREQLLWEKVQSQNRLRKQEAGHVEQIAKLEADAAKQRAMLQSVREQLEAVNDEVCALRALVADPSVPSGPTPEPPPLPAPRTPPPSSQDLLDIATPLDEDMDDCENEDDSEWPPVRRFSRVERRNKIGVIKGFVKHRRERSLTPSKHVILDDDGLPESMGIDSSGKDIADMLCNMPHEKLLEVVQNCPASMLQQFVPNVPAAIVVENPASSSG